MDVQGSFFLMKKELSIVLSVYSNSQNAIASSCSCWNERQLQHKTQKGLFS